MLTIFARLISFLLEWANSALEARWILLWLLLFLLLHGRGVIQDTFNYYIKEKLLNLNMAIEEQTKIVGAQIFSRTAGKVLKYNSACKLYRTISNEKILDTVGTYLTRLWQYRIEHIFDYGYILISICMIYVAICSNTCIHPASFAITILLMSFATFITTSYDNIYRKELSRENRKIRDAMFVAKDDLMLVPPIVQNDLEMRIEALKKAGNGKSTFMKMLTEKIQIKKSVEIPSTSRFLFYDETLAFGRFSIFEELFCCSQSPEFAKMQDILENLHLWSELKSNCLDVWQWMREKEFSKALSNGQKQRLILAKMLYWMDRNIDVLVLDECTSGLDDNTEVAGANAESVLEYIVRFANKDKRRIVIISTHQNIDGFKSNICHEYPIREFQFTRVDSVSLLTER